MNLRLKYVNIALVLIAPVFFLLSCDRPGDEMDIPTGPVPTVQHLVEQGWENYQAGNFADAEVNFEQAVSKDVFNKDAYLGLGWTYVRLDDYGNALPRFDLLVSLLTPSEDEYRYLSYAGKAAAYAGQNEDSLAAMELEKYLAIAAQDYTFDKDTKVSTENLELLLLNSYWNYQDYYNAQRTVETYFESGWLDPANNQNMDELTGESITINATIDVDTTVTPNDTTLTGAEVTVSGNYNIIKYLQVQDQDNVSYPLNRMIHGGTSAIVAVDELDSAVQQKLIENGTVNGTADFISTTDYGQYLDSLLEKIQELY